MDYLRRVRSGLAWLFGFRKRAAMEDRFAEEANYHIELAMERNRAAGMSPEEARRKALVAFGGRERFGEAARDEVRVRALDELQRDVKFSLRALRRAPGFASAAILTLALGIGATTVIFSVTDHVVLRPLAFQNPERLVLLREVIEQFRDKFPSITANASHFLEWRQRCSACGEIAALVPVELTLRGDGDPERVTSARASANLLPLLGARAQRGRIFSEAEDAIGATRVAVITDGFWRRQYGASEDIVGKAVSLSGEETTIVGVLERGFVLPKPRELGSIYAVDARMDIIIPLALNDRERKTPGEFNYSVIARLAPGATVDRVRAQLESVATELSSRNSDGMTFHSIVVPLREHIVGSIGRALLLLLAAVAALLLIVCVNLANLLLARNAERSHESAVRVSLGAGRGRLVRQALTESVVLAFVGGLLGVVLARWGLALLLHFAPSTLPRLDEITLDARVLVTSLLVTLTAGVIFGVLPAVRFGTADPAEVLKSQGGRTATEGKHVLRTRSVLVAAQVGLSALLLVSAGLFLVSFVNVVHVDKGFDVQRALAVNVGLPYRDYETKARRAQFFEAAISRLRALPGVISVASTTALPLEGDVQIDMLSLEHDTRPEAARPTASIRYVSPDYFATIGTALRAGRAFTESDRSHPVVVLSERAAKALWPNESAIGKRIWPGSNDTISEVIGVVADVRTASLEQEGTLTAYQPYWARNTPQTSTLLVRTAGDAAALAPTVRKELRALAPTVPVSRIRTMADIMSAAVAQRRFQLFVLALFAATALVTASVGIYGVVAHSLRRRTSELGVRMALGARPADVQRQVLREGLSPVAIGLGGGLTLSVALGGAVRALLFGVQPNDPVTLAGVAVVLTTVAAIACWVPARRATRMDIVRALRKD